MATRPAPRRFTVDEYYRMADVGILDPESRVELIDGEIIEMNPVGSRHAFCVGALTQLFAVAGGDRVVVWVQNPLRLDDYTEPEPDVMLLVPPGRRYADRHPTASDVLLLVEVSDTTQLYDRNVKLPRYATAGVREVWIVDLAARQVEVHREPGGDAYSSTATFGSDDTIAPEAVPEIAVRIADLLP